MEQGLQVGGAGRGVSDGFASAQSETEGRFMAQRPPPEAEETEPIGNDQVLVLGESDEDIRKHLRAIEQASRAGGSRGFGGDESAFRGKGNRDGVVQRVVRRQAKPVLWKVFRSGGRCNLMSEIWIEDKANPDAKKDPCKEYVIVHVHHHSTVRGPQDLQALLKPSQWNNKKNLTVDAVNARHLLGPGAAVSDARQYDNPFYEQRGETYFSSTIEGSCGSTLKLFPPQKNSWACACPDTNFMFRDTCRKQKHYRPCDAWDWDSDGKRDQGLASLFRLAHAAADQWLGGGGKNRVRGKEDISDAVGCFRTLADVQNLESQVCVDKTAVGLFARIDEYKNMPRLFHCREDAKAMCSSMERAAGQAALCLELSKGDTPVGIIELGEQLDDFHQRLLQLPTPPKLLIFYFAGHGLHMSAEDYVLACDFRPGAKFRIGALGVQELVNSLCSPMLDGTEKYFILDCCRELVSTGESLGCVTPTDFPPTNSVVVFSTKAGFTADDGRPMDDDHCPFCRELLCGASDGIFSSGREFAMALLGACTRYTRNRRKEDKAGADHVGSTECLVRLEDLRAKAEESLRQASSGDLSRGSKYTTRVVMDCQAQIEAVDMGQAFSRPANTAQDPFAVCAEHSSEYEQDVRNFDPEAEPSESGLKKLHCFLSDSEISAASTCSESSFDSFHDDDEDDFLVACSREVGEAKQALCKLESVLAQWIDEMLDDLWVDLEGPLGLQSQEELLGEVEGIVLRVLKESGVTCDSRMSRKMEANVLRELESDEKDKLAEKCLQLCVEKADFLRRVQERARRTFFRVRYFAETGSFCASLSAPVWVAVVFDILLSKHERFRSAVLGLGFHKFQLAGVKIVLRDSAVLDEFGGNQPCVKALRYDAQAQQRIVARMAPTPSDLGPPTTSSRVLGDRVAAASERRAQERDQEVRGLAEDLKREKTEKHAEKERHNSDLERLLAEKERLLAELQRGAEVSSLVDSAVRASSKRLPLEGFMSGEEVELLGLLREHASRKEVEAVSAALGKQGVYSSTAEILRVAVSDVRSLVASAPFNDTVWREAAQRRDEAMASHRASCFELSGACSPEVLRTVSSLLGGHLSGESIAHARGLLEALAEVETLTSAAATLEGDLALTAPDFIERHDDWVCSKSDVAESLRQDIRAAMAQLSGALKACCILLEEPDEEKLPPPDVGALIKVLRSCMEAQESWLLGLADEYRPVALMARQAAAAMLAQLERESLELSELEVTAREARQLLDEGKGPDKELIKKMSRLLEELESAEEYKLKAELGVKRAKLKAGSNEAEDQGCVSATAKLKEAKDHLKRLQAEEQRLWKRAYSLAVFFPELPARVLSISSDKRGQTFFAFADAKAWGLLDPSLCFDAYQQRSLISAQGKESRHNVWKAEREGVEVCLKQFNLGRVSQEVELKKSARTFQRELVSMSRLKHDNVIEASLFFLKCDERDKNILHAYVQYPYYPCGSLKDWLAPLDRVEERQQIRLVLFDALRGLEHVHYHGITHCDVKLANVLVKKEPDGRHRGVLADFDLSHDDEARKQERMQYISMSMASVSMQGAARGTLGVLSMAPEVIAGSRPNAKADVFSFGGMALEALYPQQAEAWSDPGSEMWDGYGRPLLSLPEQAAAQLFSLLLHKSPEGRPEARAAVSLPFFNADLQTLDLLSALEKDRVELQSAEAQHALRVAEHAKNAEEARRVLREKSDKLQEEADARKARLQAADAELKARKRQVEKEGNCNAQALAQIRSDERKLEDEREEHRRKQKALEQQKERSEKQRRETEARLAAEKRELQERLRKVVQKEAAVAVKETRYQTPLWWSGGSGDFHLVESNHVKSALQTFMRDSACCGSTKNAKVVSVHRIENKALWSMYHTKRELLSRFLAAHSSVVSGVLARGKTAPKQPSIGSCKDLSEGVNELYLFHGTSSKLAQTIAQHGFDERRAKLKGLYGAGTYFASSSCKSQQYSQDNKDSAHFVMLVCRVCMGWPYRTSTQHGQQRLPPDNTSTPGRPFDSIFAEHGIANHGKQAHNEYVVFDKCQVYPEYLVRFDA